jgi:ribonucleotide reductase alpha subunit
MSNYSIKVIKRTGFIEPLDLEKIHRMVEEACSGLSGVSASQVEMSSGIQLYDGISTADIQEILIKSAADLISLDAPNYQYVAARLLLFAIRKKLYGRIKDHPKFYEHIVNCVNVGVYDKEILQKYTEEELNKLGDYINHDRDYLFTYAGLRQVVDKYLVQDRSTGKIYETPQFAYMMMSATIFANYPQDKRFHYVKRFYDAVSKHKLNIPTPIMAGVRTPQRQFASCTLIDVDDTLDSIIASDGAMMKYIAGRAGIGLNFGRIRAINSKIRNGEVISSGVIPFLKKFESSLKSCHQGGIRQASATVYFPIWHTEIEDVIVLKNNKGTEENRVRKLDYGIQLSKIFYERFIKNQHITLFSPNDVPGLYDAFGMPEFDELYVKYENDPNIPKKVVEAQKLILDLLKERAETGRIYIMNIDHCNSHSSYLEQIAMSNLCVAGDTKIEIKFFGKDIADYRWATIDIKNLNDYINNPEYMDLRVLSYNAEYNQKEWKIVTKFAQTSPKAQVMKLKLSNNTEIVVTPDHKVYTKNRGYVMAKDLTAYDELVSVYLDESLKVVSTEYLEEEIPVYDITVDGTHNFFANDILVHNCAEITLLTKPIQDLYDELGRIALCILMAINVGKVKSDDELEELAELSVRSLDELIDYQSYPVKAAELSAKGGRTLGIGVIGLAHYLAKLGFNYEDEESWKATHGLSESIQYYLLKASNQLAKEKGACDDFGLTKYSKGILPIDTYKKEVDEICNDPLQHDWETLRQDILTYGLRNTTLTAQMPSESSSVVSNATNGIEPPRGYLSVKQSKKGPIKQIVPQYSSLKSHYTLLWDMKSNKGYFNNVAVMQKFWDQAISVNWNFNPEHYPNNEVPMSVIVEAFLTAYSVGHKTAYYQNVNDGKNDGPTENLDSLVADILNSAEEGCDSCSI